MVDHTNERSENVIVSLIQRCRFITLHVFALDRKLQPYLRLGGFAFHVGKFADERTLVTPFALCFGQIGTELLQT